jgi:hypothetical protein
MPDMLAITSASPCSAASCGSARKSAALKPARAVRAQYSAWQRERC